MHPGADIPVGERVRFYRQARRKTQAVVAGLAGVTEDYLSQIERGLKTPSTALLHRLARALGVPVSVLFGESPAEAATPGHPLSAAINTALASRGTGGNGAAPDLALLRDRVEAAWASWQASQHRYSQTGPLLPGLISDAETATRALRRSNDPAQRREACRIAADLYFLLRTFTKRIGRTDLSLLVADRALRAAEDADDPLRIAAARWNLGQVLLTIGEPEVSEEVTIKAAEEIRPRSDGDHDRAALYGALWLVAAIAAARNGDGWTARERLREHAKPAAARAGEGNVLWSVFGPVNVGLHAVSVEMESGEASDAIDNPATPDSGPGWVKSSLSYANGNCMQVARLPGGQVGVRDSKNPGAAMLRFTPAEWQALLAGARRGGIRQPRHALTVRATAAQAPARALSGHQSAAAAGGWPLAKLERIG